MRSDYGGSAVQERVVILQETANPSVDFFLRQPFSGQSVSCLSLHDTPDDDQLTGATLVVCRYLDRRWRLWIEQNRHALARLVYFFDDDLFDVRATKGLPWRYRYKLWRLARRHGQWLQQMDAEFWVSSPHLQQAYAAWRPQLVAPANPHGRPMPSQAGQYDADILFYHGSASHGADLRWLEPVLSDVSATCPNILIELIGDRHVRDLYSHLPRVRVVHPMAWNHYQALLRSPGRTIGLAPLLPTRFNAARAPTKFFDITATGAVGLYADHSVYRDTISHDHNGLLLPMDAQDAWAEAIIALHHAPDRCQRLHANACESVSGMNEAVEYS